MATLADRIGFARRKPTSTSLNLAYRPARPRTAPCCTLSGVQSGRGYPRPARPRAASPGGIGGGGLRPGQCGRIPRLRDPARPGPARAAGRQVAGLEHPYDFLAGDRQPRGLLLGLARSPASSSIRLRSRSASARAAASRRLGSSISEPIHRLLAPAHDGRRRIADQLVIPQTPDRQSLQKSCTQYVLSKTNHVQARLAATLHLWRAARHLPKAQVSFRPRGRLGPAGWVWGWWPTLSIR